MKKKMEKNKRDVVDCFSCCLFYLIRIYIKSINSTTYNLLMIKKYFFFSITENKMLFLEFIENYLLKKNEA